MPTLRECCKLLMTAIVCVSLLVSRSWAYPSGFGLTQLGAETPVGLAERYLTAFDMSLASKIKPYVMQLDEQQKQQFLKDIEKLNDAIEDEILNELMERQTSEAGGDSEDMVAAYGGISKSAVNRVVLKNQNEPWLSRVMNFAGSEIQSSIQNFNTL